MANVKTASKKPKALPKRKPVKGVIAALFTAVAGTIGNLFKGLFNPKHWLKIIAVVLLSVVINTVRAGGTGIDFLDNLAITGFGSRLLGILSFLLYAGGGVSKNASEIVTGTMAKTICAAFLVSLFSGKMKGTFKGLKLTPGSLIGKYKRPSKAVIGFGFALMVYAIICGKTGYAGIMVVISMTASALKALGNKGGMLRSLAASFNSYKVDKERHVNLTNMNAMLSGGVLGSLLSYAANGAFSSGECIMVGAVLVVAGFLLGIPTRAKCKAEVVA